MSPAKAPEMFRTLREAFEEVFHTHHGMFLDKRTSLFDTLESTTAEEASRLPSTDCASVAAHVKHVSYYLEILTGDIAGEDPGTIDWRRIWEEAPAVTSDEWDALRQRLHTQVHDLTGRLQDMERADQETFDGVLAIVVHTASHLGAIRQALRVVRSAVRNGEPS